MGDDVVASHASLIGGAACLDVLDGAAAPPSAHGFGHGHLDLRGVRGACDGRAERELVGGEGCPWSFRAIS